MTTALFTHEACHGHVTPPGHPERVARLHSVLEGLDIPEFGSLLRRLAPAAEREAIALAHPLPWIDEIERRALAAGGNPERLDEDTSLCGGSFEAALRAAGAVIAGVDCVMAGEAGNAFCAVRPPGHHAEPERPMGFCLFNSIAVAALYAQERYGLEKVAVLDFDVHHGNGTAAIFASRPDCFFASSHQMPLYPGTGSAQEKGCGNIVNMPLPPGTGSEVFRRAWADDILPALDTFAPDFIFVSAGFDGHKDDPLAQMELGDEDYAWVTAQIVARARALCQGRLVSTLEGGYDLDALKSASQAHVSELMKA